MGDLLQITDVTKGFTIPKGFLRRTRLEVLKPLSLSIKAGEAVGLVGESGSGKTTLARLIMGMLKPDSGSISFLGLDFGQEKPSAQALRQRRKDVAMVYQNPFLSLNPLMSIENLVAEPLRAFEKLSAADLKSKVCSLLEDVGLDGSYLERRIASLSGGQAQRVALARALALKPKLIILDEPTSALDVSVQAQVLNLLSALRKSQGFAFLVITHNLDVVRHMADRVLVMSKGEIVEQGTTDDILDAPQNHYTQALIAAAPRL